MIFLAFKKLKTSKSYPLQSILLENYPFRLTLLSLIKTKVIERKTASIRPFIGAKNLELSRSFYHDTGFEETVLSPGMSVFKTKGIAFYLQTLM